VGTGAVRRCAALEQYEANADMMKLNIALNTNRQKQTEKTVGIAWWLFQNFIFERRHPVVYV